MVLLSEVWYYDPGWWLAIAFGIIGSGIIAILIYLKQRNRKEITYQVISDAPIVNIDKRVEDKVKIIYNNNGKQNEINDARLLILKVWNAGDKDVKVWNSEDKDVEDFEEPIQFKFVGRTVVSLTEIETYPPAEVIEKKYLDKYLQNSSTEPETLGLPHCLLKPNQSITLSILLKGPQGEVERIGKLFDGRIVNFDDSDNSVLTLQRRAIFIGLALLVQALNEINGTLKITQGAVLFASSIFFVSVSFIFMAFAFAPRRKGYK